jgi:hypothetical protein
MMLEIGLATFAPDKVDRLTNQPWCHSLHAAVDPSECLVVSRAETGFGRVNTEHSVEAAWHLRCLSLSPEQSQDIRFQCRPGGPQDMRTRRRAQERGNPTYGAQHPVMPMTRRLKAECRGRELVMYQRRARTAWWSVCQRLRLWKSQKWLLGAGILLD